MPGRLSFVSGYILGSVTRWWARLTWGSPSVFGDSAFCETEAEQTQAGGNDKATDPVDASILADIA